MSRFGTAFGSPRRIARERAVRWKSRDAGFRNPLAAFRSVRPQRAPAHTLWASTIRSSQLRPLYGATFAIARTLVRVGISFPSDISCVDELLRTRTLVRLRLLVLNCSEK